MSESPTHIRPMRLFVASCISLVTTSMVFAIRGDIESAMSGAFHLTKEQMGLIWTPAFWGFTIAIFLCAIFVDAVGMKVMHMLSAVGYLGGLALILFAPPNVGPVESIFDETGSLMLYAGFLAMGLSQGLVEGVINPLVATLYPDKKGKMFNVLHAWWPAGMIIGGLLAFALTKMFDSPWELKIGLIALPATVYLFIVSTSQYPQTERVAKKISNKAMFREAGRPLFLLLFVCMWLTAATELGPDQWFPTFMGELVDGLDGILFLVYTAGLMFVLRFFFGGVVHRYSPFAVLTLCAVLSMIGLYWLGSLEVGSSALVALAAATLFGIGKSYFWPTMLAVVSEQFPRGGALLVNLVGGAGMLSIAVILPIIGGLLDDKGPGAALQVIALLPLVLIVVFSALYVYFRSQGGYRARTIDES